MVAAWNEMPDATPQEILQNVRHAVDRFVGSAEQFDDLTMLCLEYKGPGELPVVAPASPKQSGE